MAKDANYFAIQKIGGTINFRVAQGQTVDTVITGTKIPFTISCANGIGIGASDTAIGFFGAAAAGKQTLNAYTTNAQSAAYTSTPGTLGAAATLTDLNTLRAAYENLRLSYDNLRTILKNTTLVG